MLFNMTALPSQICGRNCQSISATTMLHPVSLHSSQSGCADSLTKTFALRCHHVEPGRMHSSRGSEGCEWCGASSVHFSGQFQFVKHSKGENRTLLNLKIWCTYYVWSLFWFTLHLPQRRRLSKPFTSLKCKDFSSILVTTLSKIQRQIEVFGSRVDHVLAGCN